MSETAAPETQPACMAVQMLCQQFANKFAADRDELAKIAFASDKMDPALWSFDTFKGVYLRITPMESTT